MAEEVETELSNKDLESTGEIENHESSEMQDKGDTGSGGKKDPALPPGFARLSSSLEDTQYKMTHKHIGHCVIFSHSTYKLRPKLKDREGADRDRDQMKELFSHLGYNVKVHNNLTGQSLKNVLLKLGQETDHTDCDSLVVVFMSHGEHNILYGWDAHFPPEKLWSEFTADRCHSLAGKPKLFFIVACRGDKVDDGVTLKVPRPEIDGGESMYKIPTQADFLISWSTCPGYYSWRSKIYGTWFVQSVVNIFRQEHGHKDVVSMLTSVNRHMIANFKSSSPQESMNGKVQTAYYVSTLMRDVYLNKKN